MIHIAEILLIALVIFGPIFLIGYILVKVLENFFIGRMIIGVGGIALVVFFFSSDFYFPGLDLMLGVLIIALVIYILFNVFEFYREKKKNT